MNKRKALCLSAGAFLLLLAIFSYTVLHGTGRLLIFNIFSGSVFPSFLNRIHLFFADSFPSLVKNKIINGFLVDGLWGISFSCFTAAFYPFTDEAELDFQSNKNRSGIKHDIIKTSLRFLLTFGFFSCSEFLQLAFPALGTFDILDLLLYALIAAAGTLPYIQTSGSR